MSDTWPPTDLRVASASIIAGFEQLLALPDSKPEEKPEGEAAPRPKPKRVVAPHRQSLPPTAKQLRFIADLAVELSIDCPEPVDRQDAYEWIQRLLAAKAAARVTD